MIEDSAISFSDFSDEWWKRIAYKLTSRTQEGWLGILAKHIKPAFPGALRSITCADAERYVGQRIEKGAAPSTVNREMTVLKHIMRRAVAWEFISRNPFLDAQGRLVTALKPLKEPSGRTRFLGRGEIGKLLQVCAFEDARSELALGYLRPFVVLALNTGMRRNEILSLRRQSIDWKNRIAKLETTKNGEGRQVHLNDAALEALRSLPTPIEADSPLFPFRPNQVSVAVKRAVRRAGIENFRLHDTRHTFASYHAMAGTAGRGLQALLGHKDNRMTMRYTHLSDEYLKTAVNGVVLGMRIAEKGEDAEKNGTHLAPNIKDEETQVAK